MTPDLSRELPFIPYCGAPPQPADLWGAWNLDPVLLAGFAAAALLYLTARLRGRLPGGWRSGAFVGAWLILFVALVSPLCNLTSALFSARVAQHLLMLQVAAPLLVVSLALGPVHRRLGWLGRPEPAWLLHGVLLWIWHLPVPYETALRFDSVLWLMHGSLFITALAAWGSLLERGDLALRGRAVLAAFGTSMHMGLLGAVLAFAQRPLFAYHFTTTQAWGLTPLADQQLGAVFMWVLGCAVYTLAALVALAGGVSGALRDQPKC